MIHTQLAGLLSKIKQREIRREAQNTRIQLGGNLQREEGELVALERENQLLKQDKPPTA